MKTNRTINKKENNIFRISLVTVLILMIPLLAMQFTDEVNWNETDFIVMGALIFGMGSMFVMTARKIHKNLHRVAVGIAFLIALFYFWAELAVGIFTNIGS